MSYFLLKAGRRERKAVELLTAAGLEHYLPMHMVAEERHGVRRLVERPLISNMLLVRAPYEEVNAFVRRHDFLHFAFRKSDKGFAILEVPDEEVEAFRQAVEKMGEELRYYAPDTVALHRGDRIRVIGGPLHGMEGTLLRDKDEHQSWLMVKFPLLGCLSARIAPEHVQIINEE